MSAAPLSALTLAAALTWLDPSAVRPGQRGVCITEWSAGERIEVPVEVVGVLDPTAPDRSAVLVRLLDERFRESGIVAGMSGSPVYIDGTLLGALAFGWEFAREPLGGVTPFTAMRELAGGGTAPAGSAPTLAQLAALATGTGEPMAALPTLPRVPGLAPRTVALAGLPLPGSFDPLARAGLATVPAGTSPEVDGVPEAGEMAAALLVWGDATLAAAGTVTARDGNRLYAFGHALFALGPVRLPAARAKVLAVQRSFQNSFKLFAVGKPFGTFVADRPAGMLAEVGAPPDGLAVAVRVREPMGDRQWNFRVAEVPILQPLMVAFLANSCLTARGAGAGEASVRLDAAIEFADGRRLALRQAVRSADAVPRMASYVGTVVAMLAGSPFPHPALRRIELLLDREERPAGLTVSEALPAVTTVAPGEEVAVHLRLQPHLETPRSLTLKVRVPPQTPPGPLDLIVADGAAWTEYRIKAEGLAPASFVDLLALLGGLDSATTLVLALESRERGVAQPGVSQPALPPSWGATLATGLGPRNVQRLATAIVTTTRWEAGVPLEGAFRFPLTVRPGRWEKP